VPIQERIHQDDVDRTMRMIDQLDPLPPAPPKDEFEAPVPAPAQAPKAVPRIKLDAPKKTTASLKFNVRRPGDKP
jgi:hypothetical protein